MSSMGGGGPMSESARLQILRMESEHAQKQHGTAGTDANKIKNIDHQDMPDEATSDESGGE